MTEPNEPSLAHLATLPQFANTKTFDDGAMALYSDPENLSGLEYYAPDGSVYEVNVAPPPPDDPGGQHRVELQRFSSGSNAELRMQSLTMAEYPSEMAAEEHAHEIGQTLLDKGLGGLEHDVNRLNLLPDDPPQSFYMMGLYPPPSPGSDEVTLNLLRMGPERVELVPIAHGPVDEVAEIEQRLFALQMEGDTNKFLKAAAVEAVGAKTLAPGTSLFDENVGDVNPAHSWLEQLPPNDEGPDHPAWPDRNTWDEPPPSRPAAMVMPVTFDDHTPFNEQGHYVPHHVDEDQTVHFFSVIPRPADSPIPTETSHELRYYRAQIDGDGLITHHSQPVMPVDDSTETPWALPTLQMHLEDGDVAAAQEFAHDIARDMHELDFPDAGDLPPLGQGEPELPPDWYHYDAALVLATPQGVDDGYSVGVVDVYANHADGQWAARYLPMGEFDAFDAALAHQQHTRQQRVATDRASAFSASGFNASPTLYEHLVEQTADAALTDLMEQNDGELPLDYEADPEPEWERLTSKEWDAYRDHLQVITQTVPNTEYILENLPTATPQLAGNELVTASLAADEPYVQPGDMSRVMSRIGQPPPAVWQVEVVPAQTPDSEQLGYSAVFVNHPVPDGPDQPEYLELGQFEDEQRAQGFKDEFQISAYALSADSPQTGAEFAELVAEEMHMSTEWRPMDESSLAQLEQGNWSLMHEASDWHSHVQPDTVEFEPEKNVPDLDL